jgi:hypothetical protein
MSNVFGGAGLFLGCTDIGTISVLHVLFESHNCYTAVIPICETVVYQDNW